MVLNIRFVKKANLWCFSKNPSKFEEGKQEIEWFHTKEEALKRMQQELKK